MRPERESLIRGHTARIVLAAAPAAQIAFKNALLFIGSMSASQNRFNYGRDGVAGLMPVSHVIDGGNCHLANMKTSATPIPAAPLEHSCRSVCQRTSRAEDGPLLSVPLTRIAQLTRAPGLQAHRSPLRIWQIELRTLPNPNLCFKPRMYGMTGGRGPVSNIGPRVERYI